MGTKVRKVRNTNLHIRKPDVVLANNGYVAKFLKEVGGDELELVPFPAMAFWFEKDPENPKKYKPYGDPIIPVDDTNGFEFGSELKDFINVTHPMEEDLDEFLSDDDDDSDGDDDEEDDEEDEDGNGELVESGGRVDDGEDDDDVIDTDGEEVTG